VLDEVGRWGGVGGVGWGYSDKDDALTYIHDTIETNEDFVFVLFIATVHVQLLDSLDTQFLSFE
jgi:hypothetical protein